MIVLFVLLAVTSAWLIEMRRADRLEATLDRIEREIALHEARLRNRRFKRGEGP